MRAEARAIIGRYARRSATYDPLDPWVYMTKQELERAYIHWLRHWSPSRPDQLRLMEIGCGAGCNFLLWLRLGLSPSNLVGSELQDLLAREARERLPAQVQIIHGDALDLPFEPETFDVVFQSLVFSSILDDSFQRDLARKMWQLAKPGGGVLWYDFIYDNPANADVRGVPLRRVRELFPEADTVTRRVTLAPPISRRVCRIHPAVYAIVNALPFLRTHLLCWLQKKSAEHHGGQ